MIENAASKLSLVVLILVVFTVPFVIGGNHVKSFNSNLYLAGAVLSKNQVTNYQNQSAEFASNANQAMNVAVVSSYSLSASH